MPISNDDIAFVEKNRSAAMITVGADGRPKAVRVGVAFVDGKLWSSGTADRVRTNRLRRDPRCTLYVYDAGFSWVALETNVTVLDGDDAPEQNRQLFRVMQDRPTGPLSWFGSELDEDGFLNTMRDERRLIYEFEITHTYGMH